MIWQLERIILFWRICGNCRLWNPKTHKCKMWSRRTQAGERCIHWRSCRVLFYNPRKK